MCSRVTTIDGRSPDSRLERLSPTFPTAHVRRSVVFWSKLAVHSCGGSRGVDRQCLTAFPFHPPRTCSSGTVIANWSQNLTKRQSKIRARYFFVGGIAAFTPQALEQAIRYVISRDPLGRVEDCNRRRVLGKGQTGKDLLTGRQKAWKKVRVRSVRGTAPRRRDWCKNFNSGKSRFHNAIGAFRDNLRTSGCHYLGPWALI
jgi:hypothetical protein